MKRLIIAAAILFTLGVNAQTPSKPQNEVIMSGEAARSGWGKTAATITNVQARLGANAADLVFDGGEWTVSNAVTFYSTQRVSIAKGTTFWIGGSITQTFSGCVLDADGDALFQGSGLVTGTVYATKGCWAAWTNGFTGTYALTCYDASGASGNALGGDLYGTIGAAQIKTGVVTTVEILDGTITSNDISDLGIDYADLGQSVRDRIANQQSNDLYSFYVQLSNSVALTVYDIGWQTNNFHMNSIDYQYGGSHWINGGATTGYYFRVPVNGTWQFTANAFITPQTSYNAKASFGLGVWVDRDRNGVIGGSDPHYYGNLQTIDFDVSPWNTTSAKLGLTSPFEYYVTTNENVMPTMYYDNLAASSPAGDITLTNAVNIYYAFAGHLVNGTQAGSNTVIAPNSVYSTAIVDGEVALADMAANSVTSTQIMDGTVVQADLAAALLPGITNNIAKSSDNCAFLWTIKPVTSNYWQRSSVTNDYGEAGASYTNIDWTVSYDWSDGNGAHTPTNIALQTDASKVDSLKAGATIGGITNGVYVVPKTGWWTFGLSARVNAPQGGWNSTNPPLVAVKFGQDPNHDGFFNDGSSASVFPAMFGEIHTNVMHGMGVAPGSVEMVQRFKWTAGDWIRPYVTILNDGADIGYLQKSNGVANSYDAYFWGNLESTWE